MAVNFSRCAQPHPYDTPEYGADFLPYLYELTRLTGEDLQIVCRTKAVNTMKMMLSYGRKNVAKHMEADGNPLFAPFAVLASHVVITADTHDAPNILRLRPNQYFTEAFALMPNTTLFSFFRAVDEWAVAPNLKPISRRWNPPLPPLYLRAIEKFARLRAGTYSDCSLSTTITIFTKL